jgi:uncharacterized protein (TIGR02271 family)
MEAKMKTKTPLGSKKIIAGTLIGGIISVVAYLLLLPSPTVWVGFLVFSVGSVVGGIVAHQKEMKDGDHVDHYADTNRDARLLLRQEELDIITKRMDTADVQVHIEVISEEKTFTVPITREELVIQISDKSKNKDSEEIIRIPICEDEVDVTTHPVKINDVSIFKQQIKETKHVDETLKRETVNVNVTGNVTVHDTEES